MSWHPCCCGGGNPSISNGPPPNGQVQHVYSFTYTATGGTLPYTWSVTGTLPPGLTFTSAGVLSGTPTTPGNFTGLTFKVTDAHGNFNTQSASIIISP